MYRGFLSFCSGFVPRLGFRTLKKKKKKRLRSRVRSKRVEKRKENNVAKKGEKMPRNGLTRNVLPYTRATKSQFICTIMMKRCVLTYVFNRVVPLRYVCCVMVFVDGCEGFLGGESVSVKKCSTRGCNCEKTVRWSPFINY